MATVGQCGTFREYQPVFGQEAVERPARVSRVNRDGSVSLEVYSFLRKSVQGYHGVRIGSGRNEFQPEPDTELVVAEPKAAPTESDAPVESDQKPEDPPAA